LFVRAWGVADEELMKKAYNAGVDGMTIDFPEKLIEFYYE
jgi:glycerophosphoryl diester phosphodiesterase